MSYPEPGYPNPSPQHAPASPWYRHWWALAVAAVLVLLIGAGIGAAAGPTKTTTVAGPTTVHTATATETATETATATITTTPTRVIATRTKTHRVVFTPQPAAAVTDGTYLVGPDLKPGLYQTDGIGDGSGCYWERDRDLTGGLNSIIDNDNITGPTTVQLSSGDAAFTVSGGCEWRKR